MRLFRWLAVIVILMLNVMPVVVLAAKTATVTITAMPLVATGGILTFTATSVSSTHIDLDVTVSVDVTDVMIRGEYNRYPSDITDPAVAPDDGYLVYYGAGLAASDTSVDLSENVASLYYKAWAQKGDGTWYLLAKTAKKESEAMAFLAFILLALGLSIPAFIWRKAVLAFAGAGAWIIFAVYCYTKSTMPSTGIWDIYYAAFFLGIGLTLVSSLEPAIMRTPKAEIGEDDETPLSDVDAMEKEFDELSRQTRIPRIGNGRRRNRVAVARKGPQY